MNVWTKRGYDIFNPVDAAGNPRKVINGEVQVWSTEVERAVYYAMISGNLAYATKADLDADLDHDEGTVAWVVADTEALNGIYVKSGASGSGSWTKERNLPTGPQGDVGGVAYRFDAGTAGADPGAGLIRANNADLSAATELYVSKTNRYGDDLSGFLATLAGSTSSHKGYLVLTAPDSETQAAFGVTGVADAAGYVKLAVTGQGGATAFSDAERLIFLFSRTGNAGDLNGVTPGATGRDLLAAETQAEARDVIGLREVTPYQFEAVGNGIADDTSAVLAAITSGSPVFWGGPESVYRITAPIDETLVHTLNWRSSGARILYDPPSATQHCIKLLVGVGTQKVSGVLRIDANEKSFHGLFVGNAPGTIGVVPYGLPDFIADDLHVTKVYRSSTAFNGGDGIHISGAWRNVKLTRPNVTECKMAVGAGVAGSQGIFGITVADDNSGNSPQNVTIIDPYVDTIFSEDDAYYSDQDGIRVFSDYNAVADGNPLESSFLVVGGTIRNCRNRSIKCQMQNGRVIGTKLVKTADIDPGAAGVGSQYDIDFQVGGGQVHGIEVYYDGYVPPAIINFTETESTLKPTAKGIVSGVSGVILGGSTLLRILRVSTSDDVGKFSANLSNVILEGPVGEIASLRVAPNAQRRLTVVLSEITLDLQTVGVTFIGSSGLGARVYMNSVNNSPGATVPLFSNAGGQTNRSVSTVNCTGFDDAPDVTPSAAGAFTRVNAIAPETATSSGIIRPLSIGIADGETYDLPLSGYSNGHLLFVCVGINSNTYQGLFAVSTNGVIALTPEATSFEVGTTTEPGTGAFRIWGAAGGPKISNRSGTARQVFILQVG